MLAIHSSSGEFAKNWIAYCKEKRIPYRDVNCFSDDIFDKLKGCTMLMWHWQHFDYRATLFARQLITAAEMSGIYVFPSIKTCFYYDDKLGQKYLLESLQAPMVCSHAFYDRNTALAWCETAVFPLVWKLRTGAGSQNVKLVRNIDQARSIINRSFRGGWRADRFYPLRERLWQFHKEPGIRSLIDVSRGFGRTIFPHENNRRQNVERNYVYFQDYAPDNTSDIRVIVIGNRAFGIRRMVREGDFRASGSGVIRFEPSQIPESCIVQAFRVTRAAAAQCCAFDFVWHKSQWSIVEISYAFSASVYHNCTGWWDPHLNWNEEPVRPERYIIEDMITNHASGRTSDV